MVDGGSLVECGQDRRHRIDEFIEPDILLPAPGQGALALETRADDDLSIEVAYAIRVLPEPIE